MKEGTTHPGLEMIQKPRAVEASLWRRLRIENQHVCRETLFNRYHALAKRIARHEFRRRPSYGLDRTDFEQLAYSGLLQAIDAFDPLRGVPFAAYAQRRIRGSISDGLSVSSENGAQYAYRRRIELERLKSVSSGRREAGSDHVSELADIAVALAIGLAAESAANQDAETSTEASPYESVAWQELQLSILQEIERLSETERSVIQQHYLNGVAFKDIATLLGLSKGRVSQLHRSGLHRIRMRLRSGD